MEIVVQLHKAVVSRELRARAERAVRKAAGLTRRPVDAVVRFEQDGPLRRVVLELHAPARRALVAHAEGRWFGPLIVEAASRLEARIRHRTRTALATRP